MKKSDVATEQTAGEQPVSAGGQAVVSAEQPPSVPAIDAERMYGIIAGELQLKPRQIRVVDALLADGNTIPFIARYRKEMTGELDETQLRAIRDRLAYLRQLEERKAEVIRLIDEQGKLTDELRDAILRAVRLQEVEDLYRPYRQKRKTRASVARERGLEPLAKWLLEQPEQGDPLAEAANYIDEEKGVATAEDALQGAMDILAEDWSDDAAIRQWVRRFTRDHGMLQSRAKDPQQESVYEMYYAFEEPVRRVPPHRVLAVNRGEREGVLTVGIAVPEDQVLEGLKKRVIRGPSATREILARALEDSYRRLIAPSVEREIRGELTEKAEEKAIGVFSENLRHLLLQPPVKGHVVLGVDPAYRTGCKLAVVDETGKLLETAVAYPTPPHNRKAEAAEVFRRLIEKHGVDLIAIGNGTASRETELFVAELIRGMPERGLRYVMVSEAGASVYSASDLAKEEFPDLDVAERSAVSIARRLQDPLAELVKIEPKSIGVGQYQHDVSQKRLEESLADVVESAVNHVGVDVNTASPSLLAYVSGINAGLAKNIVKFREERGKFRNREDLREVPRLGAKTFEQCAGFLRIPDGDNPLDKTPIHPESYGVVERLFAELGLSLGDVGTPACRERLADVNPAELAPRLGVGEPTLRDILDSLRRPGRDPREDLPPPIFRTDVLDIEDLKPGMELKGTVRNVVDFGAFVDIGIKNDGLVHISQMSDRYIRHPSEVVTVGDTVTVWVLDVDVKRGRVGLTMKGPVS